MLGFAPSRQRPAARQVAGIVLGPGGVYLLAAEDVALLSAPLWA